MRKCAIAALGLLCMGGYATPLAAQGSAPATPDGSSYNFGGALYLVLSSHPGLVILGPMGSRVTGCSTDELLCVDSELLTIAVPRRCGVPLAQGLSNRSGTHSLGQVTYRHPRQGTMQVELIYAEQRPRAIIGYAQKRGVVLIMMDQGIEPADRLRPIRQAKGPALQRAFDQAGAMTLPIGAGPPLFPCEGAADGQGAFVTMKTPSNRRKASSTPGASS